MIFSIPLIIDGKINPVFVKANREILENKEIDNIVNLIAEWKNYYNAYLDLENNTINFDTEKNQLHFILNFS